jgi:VIT family protein
MGKGSLLHRELHRSGRIGWLRAAVLGSDDGIVSVASLMIGVAAANASRSAILVAGVAGLVAGAMSMATGEYVSVASQRDAEHADIARERREQMTDQVGSEEGRRRGGRSMTVNRTRSALYSLVRFLGDAQAVKHSRVSRRLVS